MAVLVIVVVMAGGVKVMEATKLVEMGVAMVTMSTGGSGGQDGGNDDAVVADGNIQCWHLMSVENNGNIDMVAMALGMKKIEVLKSNEAQSRKLQGYLATETKAPPTFLPLPFDRTRVGEERAPRRTPGEKGTWTRMRAANRMALPRLGGQYGLTCSFPATTVCSRSQPSVSPPLCACP